MKTLLSMLLLGATAIAGPSFRLEVGPSVALGTSQKVKGPSFAVRALACDDVAHVAVTATAEAIVDGQRFSHRLVVGSGATPGTFAVYPRGLGEPTPQHLATGTPFPQHWLIHVTGTCSSPASRASTLVPMEGSNYMRDKVQVLTAPATSKQVDAALAALARQP